LDPIPQSRRIVGENFPGGEWPTGGMFRGTFSNTFKITKCHRYSHAEGFFCGGELFDEIKEKRNFPGGIFLQFSFFQDGRVN